MKCMLLFCSILSIFALKGENLCINCKHFKKDLFEINKFGKCSLFPREIHNKHHLVDGSPNIPINEYFYCSTARGYEDMCGKMGILFEKKGN